jgi:transcriptional accessory protein Tex/SPT6
MRRFFDKRATLVDVSDKEVIDLFQDGLYHRRTFEDFVRRRPSSITHLKDMITSWADEEDKTNAKYDAICSKSKQSAGGGSSNNGNQGGRNNNNNPGPNRKRKPDNTVTAIQRPVKENSKKTSGRQRRLPGTRQDSQRPLRRTTRQTGTKGYPSRSHEH